MVSTGSPPCVYVGSVCGSLNRVVGSFQSETLKQKRKKEKERKKEHDGKSHRINLPLNKVWKAIKCNLQLQNKIKTIQYVAYTFEYFLIMMN